MTTPMLFDAVGWAVIHSLWQGLLIGGVVLLLLHANRTRSASMRHATAFLGLLAMLVAFAATTTLLLVEGADTSARVAASTGTSGHLETPTVTNGIPRAGRAPERDPSWIPGVITWAWLAGVGLMTVRLFGQWWWSRRLRSQGTEPTDAAWAAIFESLRARCGVGERVRLLVSRAVDSPMVVGWLHPVILVPASAFTALDPEQLRTILVHELHHLARRDHLLNMMQAVIEVVLFFHPVTWWLSRQVRIEREFRCDDATLEMTDSPRSLAEALLALESLRTLDDTRPSLQLAATGGSLMHRITRLTGSNPEPPHHAGWRIVSASAILAVAGTAVVATNLESPGTFQPQAERADDPVDRRARIEERLPSLGELFREQAAAESRTREDWDEAREKYADPDADGWYSIVGVDRLRLEDWDEAREKYADPDADGWYSIVGVDRLRLAAKGEFVGEDQVQLRVDIVITATGDPPRTIASPSVTTTVGKDAVVQLQGNGEGVVCSIATRRDGSGVIVTVTAVVERGNTTIDQPTLRFRLP